MIMPSSVGLMNQREKQLLGCLAVPQSKDLPQGARQMTSPWGKTRADRDFAAQLPEVAIDPAPPPPPPTSKVCRTCGLEKPIECFTRIKGRWYASDCKPCQSAGRNWDVPSNDPDMRYDRHLRHTYGITLAEYNAMFAKQKGLCAICKQPETAVGGRLGTAKMRLAVDHDHERGPVRGLLCIACNQGIGQFKHDPQLLLAAIEYLRQPKLL